MWGPARTQLLTDSFFFFFTKLVFRLSPGLEAELSASGHESVQPLIAQGHKTTPIVMCRHRRQGLGRGARPGLRGSTFLMPRYNPFLCSLFSLSCYIWAVSPPSLVAVHHFLFPSLLFFWFPFFFSFLCLHVISLTCTISTSQITLSVNSLSTCYMPGTVPSIAERMRMGQRDPTPPKWTWWEVEGGKDCHQGSREVDMLFQEVRDARKKIN